MFHWYNSCPQVPFTQAIHRKGYQSTLFTDTLATVHTFHKPQLRFWDIHSRAPVLSHEVTRALKAPLGSCTLPSRPPPNVPPLARSRSARRQHLLRYRCLPAMRHNPRRQAGRSLSHGHGPQPANGSWRELGRLAYGHGRRGRSGGVAGTVAELLSGPRASGHEEDSHMACEKASSADAPCAPR